MTISDQSRHRLHQRLDEILGVDDAATLMEHLPPVGWADVATKRDLDRLAIELRAEMQTGFAEGRTGLAELRTELHQSIGGIRQEIAAVGVQSRGQMQTLFL